VIETFKAKMNFIKLLLLLNTFYKAVQCESIASMSYDGSLFKLCPDNGVCSAAHFILKFQYLVEIDEFGNEIVDRRAYNFVNYDYTWTNPILETDENGANRTKSSTSYSFKINNDPSQLSTMELTTYLYHGASTSVHANQVMDIPIDNLKFTLKIGNWPFLDNNNKLRFAMRLKVKTRNGRTIEAEDIIEKAVGNNTGIVQYDMGENAFVNSPVVCDVDGNVGTVIPKYESRTDEAYDLIWDFPHYSNTLVYDPVIGYATQATQAPNSKPSSMPSTSSRPSLNPTLSNQPSFSQTISNYPPVDANFTNSSLFPSLRPSKSPTDNTPSPTISSGKNMIPAPYCHGLVLLVLALIF